MPYLSKWTRTGKVQWCCFSLGMSSQRERRRLPKNHEGDKHNSRPLLPPSSLLTTSSDEWLKGGKPGHGRNAGQTRVPATASSIVGKSHSTHMSNGKDSVSEEPTVYSEEGKVESQCEMLSENQRSIAVNLERRLLIPRGGSRQQKAGV